MRRRDAGLCFLRILAKSNICFSRHNVIISKGKERSRSKITINIIVRGALNASRNWVFKPSVDSLYG